MKPLCPKCLTTHWEEQACKVKSLAELPAIFPSPPVEPTKIDDSFHNPEMTAIEVLESQQIPQFTTNFPDITAKPKKVLSKAHLAALKAGREARMKK